MITLAQLEVIGLGARTVHYWCATGRLSRVHRGVYSMAPPALLTRRGLYMAAVLACGEGAVLSHRSAADLHELRAKSRERIEVTIRADHTRTVKGVQVHRSTTLTPRDVTTVDGIPCTTVARTLLDLAGVLARRPVERALEQAEVQHTLNFTELDRQLEANQHTSAAHRLRKTLAGYDDRGAPTESEFEERFLALCRASGLPLPERQVYIDPDDGEPPIRADFVWRKQKLVVETDGARYHRTKAAFESDRRKDQRLILAGWRVVRITWRQLKHEPERILEMIERVLRQG